MFFFNYIDHLFDRIYTSKYNPLYQSGVLAIFLLGLVVATGSYLVFFYRIGSPYESVATLQQQWWTGRWIRSLHHYAADAAVVATLYHWLRIMIQKRFWGPRLLAWVSGMILLVTIFLSGITGLILVWDVQGKVLIVEIARLLDFFPFFSEPIGMAFDGSEPLSRSFFFLTLFIHVSMPLGLGFLLWLHTSKLARPTLLPPRALMVGSFISLWALSVVFALPLAPKAEAYLVNSQFPIDVFYSFWLPFSTRVTPSVSLLIFLGVFALLFLIPWIFNRATQLFHKKVEEKLLPSFVHEKSCTGCTSCYNDCPFDAIDMVPRTLGGGSEFVAKVTPDRCVSCGICAAACDPMGVGPAGRTGRDQIKELEKLLSDRVGAKKSIVIMGCQQSITWPKDYLNNPNYIFHFLHCAGGLHTATIEYALKRGVRGIFILTCPERNCSNREGPKWLRARLYENHDSFLNPLINKRLIRLIHAGAAEKRIVIKNLEEFSVELKRMEDIDYSTLKEKECLHTQ